MHLVHCCTFPSPPGGDGRRTKKCAHRRPARIVFRNAHPALATDVVVAMQESPGSHTSMRPLEPLLKLVNRLQVRRRIMHLHKQHGYRRLGLGKAKRHLPSSQQTGGRNVIATHAALIILACGTLNDGGLRARWRQHRRRAPRKSSECVGSPPPDRRRWRAVEWKKQRARGYRGAGLPSTGVGNMHPPSLSAAADVRG